jgi:PAS domain S-box-containing protein
MKDKDKTKEQLIEELATLRQKVSDLETLVAQQQQKILFQQSQDEHSQHQFISLQPSLIELIEHKKVETVLHENQLFLQRIIETTPDIIYIYDLVEQRNIYLNHQIVEILGYSLQEIQAMKEVVLPNLIHPDDMARVREHLKRFETTNEGETLEIEYRMRATSGDWRWLRSRETVFAKNVDGLRVQILGVASDITEQKQMLEALQDSEARLRLTLDAARMITWDWNITTNRVIDYNSAEPLCGLPLGTHEHRFEDFLDTVYFEDRDPVVAAIKNAIENRQDYEVEFRLLSPDNKLHWIGNKGQVYYEQNGQPIRMVGVAMDITERKLAEHKIREQAALLDVATDAIVVRNLQHKIVFWNRSAERLYGWKAKDALGKNANKLLYKKKSLQLEEALSQVNLVGEWYGELSQVRKDGKEVIVETRWTLVRDEQGNPKSILIVNTDITAKKQLQAQFLRAQRLESLGTLASGITHDLNNILAPMLMSAQLLQMKISDTRNQQLLQTLETNAQRGAALVKQVLSFARGVEGRRTILQMRHLILEIEHFAKQTFPKSIEFCLDIAPNLWTVSGDATQLHQVLMNLVINARDAMPNGGILSISAENFLIDENYASMNLEATVGPHVLITIKDTGIGMSPEILDRIFEPFFTTKEVGKGSGLGLATVLGIMKSHRGFVSVSSSLGKGTQFQVFLKAALENELPPAESWELPMGKGELILVVDDEAEIRQITKLMLESYNYKVLAASDGVEAIVSYAQNREDIRVVFVDMMMPVMDGLTTIRTLRKMNPYVKIIAASGLADTKQLMSTLGVEKFLPKPYTIKQLLDALYRILN